MTEQRIDCSARALTPAPLRRNQVRRLCVWLANCRSWSHRQALIRWSFLLARAFNSLTAGISCGSSSQATSSTVHVISRHTKADVWMKRQVRVLKTLQSSLEPRHAGQLALVPPSFRVASTALSPFWPSEREHFPRKDGSDGNPAVPARCGRVLPARSRRYLPPVLGSYL